MRITKLTRYPHPVLSDNTGDYVSGLFSIDLEISESKNTGQVRLTYVIDLDEPEIKYLVSNSMARIGLFVVCSRTYFNKLCYLEPETGTLEFCKGELRDRVIIRPIVCAIEQINDFSSVNLHQEFKGTSWNFQPSDVLALGAEIQIDVGLDKLAPMESIFELVAKEEIPAGETRIELERPKIGICANKDTCQGIYAMRNATAGRLALLNGVYLPAIMQILSILSQGTSTFEQYKWFSVFSAKCLHTGIDLQQNDPHQDAQKLLRSPLKRMIKAKEFKPL